MSTANREQLLKLLKAADTLTGSSGGSEAKDVAQVLKRRLEAACVILSDDDFTPLSTDKLVLQKETADHALDLLERMQDILDVSQGVGGRQMLEFWPQIPARLISFT